MEGSRRQAIVIVLVLALVLTWMVFEQVGERNPLRDAASGILTPLQYALKRGTSPLSGAIDLFGDLRNLRERNQALEEENARLRSEMLLLREAQIENETLREQLRFSSSVPHYRMLAAEVIGHDPNNMLQYLLLDRGTDDGLELGMPVLVASGLVGRLSEVSQSSAKVMLITDASSSVSSLIQRSRATGMVQGRSDHELVMRYIPQEEPVEVGDIVLTSGLGGNLPKRIVVGQVVAVDTRDVDMFQEARLVPAADMRNLEAVMVVLSFGPADAAVETETAEIETAAP